MSDLKPCPFCGSEAEFWTRQAHEAEEYQTLIIDCKDCPANMEEWVYKYDKNFAENFEKKKAEMFEAWNRRTEQMAKVFMDLRCVNGIAYHQYICSACDKSLNIPEVGKSPDWKPKYCVNCGARLE